MRNNGHMRYLSGPILSDLNSKMVLLSGPRQVGKTYLANALLGPGDLYLNWDDPDHRRRIRRREWSDDAGTIALDEIHKFAKWRNWLKGTYDTQKAQHRFLVTGSARLDLYRRGGDSILGRYHAWRLHPICLAEHAHGLQSPPAIGIREAFDRLLRFGGFPEPYLSGDETTARRWRKERRELILREDLRDLERVREVSQVGLLLDLLTERVGGMIVASNLAEDLDVAPRTVQNWMDILERLYLGFRVKPFTGKMARAIRKPPKFYFFDNADVPAQENGSLGPRFENLVATHLLKRLNFLEDSQGEQLELRYVRDKEGHECDFVVLRRRKPVLLVEAKWSDATPSRDLSFFGDRLGVTQRVQVVAELHKSITAQGTRVVPASDWLSLPLDEPLWS